MKRLGRHLRDTYLTFDARSLGLFRIALGCVLLLDLALRARVVDFFYTNEGLIPNHTVLWAPPTRRMLSFFFMASTRGEALLGMAICAVCFFCLLIGYRTRLFHVLSLLCVISLNTRIAVLENGGDVVLNILCLWTVFLPLGKRFSVDAVRAAMRTRKERGPADLANRTALIPSDPRVRSLAVLALILQFSVIYFFNVVHKTGPTWMEGTAVHYTLHQDRIATWLAVWLRENLSVEILRGLAWATLVIESSAVVCLLSPLWPQFFRGLAVLLLPGLHLSFAACLNIGVFSYVMASYFLLLLGPTHWKVLYRLMRRLHRPRVCYYDADCSVCLLCARIVARLDVLSRIELRDNRGGDLPSGVDEALIQRTVVVQNRNNGRVYTRSAAIAQLFRSLPGGWPVWLVLSIPGLSQLFDVVYDRVSDNRTAIGSFFGLSNCGTGTSPGTDPSAGQQSAVPVDNPDAPSPARLWLARNGRRLLELAVAVLMVTSLGEVLKANRAVPSYLRYKQPDALQMIVDYGRLIQSWRMFAPHAPTEDETIVVEARTVDGRTIDPYNLYASRPFKRPLHAVPARLGNDQFFCTYSLYIPQRGYRALITAFQEWILRHHERTGNPRDRIVRFVAYQVLDKSPPPGETEPRDMRKNEFLRYPR